MAKDKNGNVCFQENWFHELEDDRFGGFTIEEQAYLIYAIISYGVRRKSGEETDSIEMGSLFGDEYKGLNRTLASYLSQVDRMVTYNPAAENDSAFHFDSDKIKELAAVGNSCKEICEKLGYPSDKDKSMSTNKGWKEGREIWKKKVEEEKKKTPENVAKEVSTSTSVLPPISYIDEKGGFNF